jgi:hypothetical protein
MVRIIDKITKKEAHIERLWSDYFIAWIDEEDVGEDMKEFAGIKSVRFGRLQDLNQSKNLAEEGEVK